MGVLNATCALPDNRTFTGGEPPEHCFCVALQAAQHDSISVILVIVVVLVFRVSVFYLSLEFSLTNVIFRYSYRFKIFKVII